MAGEWIKMRTNLWDDPRVASMCDLTGLSEAAVIGGLYWLWSMADEHTEDGFLPRLTLSAIDRKTGIKGLAASLVSVGWIEDGVDGIRILSFEEHNGASAKRRCMEAKRKAESRDSPGDPHDVRNVSASDADKTRTESGSDAELDKREIREDKKNQEKGEKPRASRKAPPDLDCPGDVEAQVWCDFQTLRKAKKAPITETVIKTARGEAVKAGIAFNEFLKIWCNRGSQGLEARWLTPQERGSPRSPPPNKYAGASAAIWEDEATNA